MLRGCCTKELVADAKEPREQMRVRLEIRFDSQLITPVVVEIVDDTKGVHIYQSG